MPRFVFSPSSYRFPSGSFSQAGKAADSLKNSHLYGRHLVIDFAKEDDDVEEIREKTKKYFEATQAESKKRSRKALGDDADESFSAAFKE